MIDAMIVQRRRRPARCQSRLAKCGNRVELQLAFNGRISTFRKVHERGSVHEPATDFYKAAQRFFVEPLKRAEPEPALTDFDPFSFQPLPTDRRPINDVLFLPFSVRSLYFCFLPFQILVG